ncbi:filaggrin-like isoform X2 [Varroa jacobsoni]|uniref:filaggrin-like isoform X2 n=1 Tax=Varroa jacobsoni TaxID=62625 RepID=UPI000BF8C0A8|nr:filaggrin-like isoform X2 [Varroa jacobsoni]
MQTIASVFALKAVTVFSKTHREPPYKIIKCSVGKSYNEKCRSSKECLLADQYSDCIGGICRCPPSYIPIPVANNSLSLFRCMIDPFYLSGDHANLTFFKVSPVPLLVICIILVYLGYQRGAKVPQRRGSSTTNRRIVPMWRGVTFHQTTPVSNGSGSAGPSGQTAVTPPRNSTSGSSGGGALGGVSQMAVESGGSGGGPGSGGQRRESSGGAVSAGAGERDSRRGRGFAHSRRDSGARERQERGTANAHTHSHNIAATHPHSTGHAVGSCSGSSSSNSQQHPHHVHELANGISERRNSAMSPPPPYAEEAPPSYEDAIRASRVAMRLEEATDLSGLSSNNNYNVNANSSTSSDDPQNVVTGYAPRNSSLSSSGRRDMQQQQSVIDNTASRTAGGSAGEGPADASTMKPPLYSQA